MHAEEEGAWQLWYLWLPLRERARFFWCHGQSDSDAAGGSPHSRGIMPRMKLLLLVACTAAAVAAAFAANDTGGTTPDLLPEQVYTSRELDSNETTVVAPNTAVAGAALGAPLSGVAEPAACGALCRAEEGRCVWFEYCGAQVGGEGCDGRRCGRESVHSGGEGARSVGRYPPCAHSPSQPVVTRASAALSMPSPSSPSPPHLLQIGCPLTGSGEPLAHQQCRLLAANCSVHPIVTTGFPIQVASGAVASYSACGAFIYARAPACSCAERAISAASQKTTHLVATGSDPVPRCLPACLPACLQAFPCASCHTPFPGMIRQRGRASEAATLTVPCPW